jgi:hypothetical protein
LRSVDVDNSGIAQGKDVGVVKKMMIVEKNDDCEKNYDCKTRIYRKVIGKK